MKPLGGKWFHLIKRIVPILVLCAILIVAGCGGSESSNASNTSNTDGASDNTESNNEQNTISLNISAGSDPKTLMFQWNADLADPVDHFRLEVEPDGASGFSLVEGADNLVSPDFDLIVPLHLTDWQNIRYRVTALDSTGRQLAVSESKGPLESVNITELIGYFKAGNAEDGDEFGNSIALSADGSTLAVGAPYEENPFGGINNSEQNSNGASDVGAVYVFAQNDAGIWQQQAYIKASDPEEGDYFGISLDLSADGDTLVVGASGKNEVNEEGDDVSDLGAAYVYQRNNNGIWREEVKFVASNAGFSDQFGFTVALAADGNTMAVGAIDEESGSIDDPSNDDVDFAGAVYIFIRDNNGDWSETDYLKARIPGVWDEFCKALALSADGGTLAVGAPGEDSASTSINGEEENDDSSSAGAVYLFTRSDNVYEQTAYIKAHNAGSGHNFGSSVALSADGNTLAVGAPYETSAAVGINNPDVGETTDSGAAYVFFRENSGSWRQEAYIKADISMSEYYLGVMVSLTTDGNTLLVGASGDDAEAVGINVNHNNTNAENSGAAFLFSRDNLHNWKQTTYIKPSNPDQFDYFGVYGDISADGDILVLSAPHEDGLARGINGDQDLRDENTYRVGAVYMY